VPDDLCHSTSVGDDGRPPARHGFQDHVPKGFGVGWKEKEISHRVGPRELFAVEMAGEAHASWGSAAQPGQTPAGSYDHESHGASRCAPDPLERVDKQIDSLLGGDATYENQDAVSTLSQLFSRGHTPMGRVETLGVNSSGPETKVATNAMPA